MAGNHNPFLDLFETPREPEGPHVAPQTAAPAAAVTQTATAMETPAVTPQRQPHPMEGKPLGGQPLLHPVNDLVESAFALTLNQFRVLGRPSRDGGLVWLQEFSEGVVGPAKVTNWMEDDLLERALFERLLMTRQALSDHVVADKSVPLDHESHLLEARCVIYLSTCYDRLSEKGREDGSLRKVVERMKNMVVLNLATAFREPDIYHGQQLSAQLVDVLQSGKGLAMLRSLVDIFPEESDGRKNFAFHLFAEQASRLPEGHGNLYEWSTAVQLLESVLNGKLAEYFMLYNVPAQPNSGIAFGETMLGRILSASCLPRHEVGPYEYFENPSQSPSSVHAKVEENVWTSSSVLQDRLHSLFKVILKSGPDSMHRALLWIGECLMANAGRGKLWTAQMRGLMASPHASDGFMINLGGVLLRLCDPFIQGCRNSKLLKIDLRYNSGVECQTEEERKAKHVHLFDLSKDSCIQHGRSPPQAGKEGTFNFITDIFFITHKCLDVGHRVVFEKLLKLNQELNRLQHLMMDGGQASDDLRKEMDASMTRYLCLKAAILEPSSLRLLAKLVASTGALLVHHAFSESPRESTIRPPTFPMKEELLPREPFYFTPEFFFENICETLLLLKRFCPGQFEDADDSSENFPSVVMDWILTFMAAPVWVKNPHLRAKLAECLDCLLPVHNLPGGRAGSYVREQLFLSYPNRSEIVPALMHVFVDIEATGQAVQFELKFSYRKPMYDVMKYLWELQEHKRRFHELAKVAVLHIEDKKAPLFLRFVNLLVNDAIFLLDEGLSYMKQMQEQEGQRADWEQLPQAQRSQNEAQFHHIGRLARYHNIMGMETIGLLALFTTEIHEVFSHTTMVDRIAAMLNYFLKSLVGSERNNFKVKNLEQYEFKPAEIVTKICTIYVNLKNCEPFIGAVSQDGRSYSPMLFEQAREVLTKINQFDILEDLDTVAKKVQSSSTSQQEEDLLFADAPDHFMDPIMSILMRDPVKLPTSGKIVDRQTIARHLLSDQMDPFNRMPLTLDKVIGQTDLKLEIEAWIQQRKQMQVEKPN